MHHYVKKLALTMSLALLATINGALAQTPPLNRHRMGLVPGYTGHPVADFVVVVAILVIGALSCSSTLPGLIEIADHSGGIAGIERRTMRESVSCSLQRQQDKGS